MQINGRVCYFTFKFKLTSHIIDNIDNSNSNRYNISDLDLESAFRILVLVRCRKIDLDFVLVLRRSRVIGDYGG